MKAYIGTLLSILVFCLSSCYGPRNIYSASPFVSPVRMEKRATAIEANYFTHTGPTNARDTHLGNRDNCFGLTFSHMLKERTLVFASTDFKNERNQFHDSTDIFNNSLYDTYNAYNAGFDSSIVFGKRYSFGAGIEFFSDDLGKVTSSLVVSVGFHQLNMKESGLLLQAPYQRFYKVNQLSLSLQSNLLFKVSSRFNLAWVTSLSLLNTLKANTDYSSGEMLNAGLRDRKIDIFFCATGIYADYKPLRKIPIYITGQFFNDLSLWKHSFAKYELGRTYVKGTGVSVGMKYIFKIGKNDKASISAK
ncbi:MAG: hypothetical protein ACM3H8_14655 [Sphingobacteriales bacterium]